MVLLEFLVKRGAPWRKALPETSAKRIYNALESQYIPPALANLLVPLMRATAGIDADTPYREAYRDEDSGWRKMADRLELVNVGGGHSSMREKHAIDSLVTAMLERLSALAAPTAGSVQ